MVPALSARMSLPQVRHGALMRPLFASLPVLPSMIQVVPGPDAQSAGQLAALSVPLHAPSPHAGGGGPQSAGQLAALSVPLHAPSPHTGGGGPQSAGQLAAVSPPLHAPSPHT